MPPFLAHFITGMSFLGILIVNLTAMCIYPWLHFDNAFVQKFGLKFQINPKTLLRKKCGEWFPWGVLLQ